MVNAIHPAVACFATGIAGTPDQSFYVSTSYWDGSEWWEVSINNYSTTGFLTLEQCRKILNDNNSRILHYDVNLGRFLQKAEEINKALHRNSVAPRDRAKMVAGLLLALAEDSNMRISDKPRTLVQDVNARIEALLAKHKKEHFKAEVVLKLPNTQENHKKYRSAIVQTMQHLREMNIRSAINSGTDALGQFYETFLKYANDASEMGIVLTPRHITKLAVDVMNIQPDDLIFDPTCGTGGFLVAALDKVRRRHFANHPDVFKAFRNDCLFGVEQADDVFGLALVNMIFRGDGKSHIHNGNCFDNRFVKEKGKVIRRKPDLNKDINFLATRPFTRVLMNPPFAVEEKERQFVDYALDQMDNGGLLFAILPNAPITGGNNDLRWRRKLLKRHTVRAVVKLPFDLFMPGVTQGTWALILEAWRPHTKEDPVFFGLLHDDRSANYKSKLLGDKRAFDNVEKITKNLARFLRDGRSRIESVPREITISRLEMGGNWDFASEAYLESDTSGSTRLQPVEGLFAELVRSTVRTPPQVSPAPKSTRNFELPEMFTIERGKCLPLKTMAEGSIPVVSCSEKSNGIAGYYDVPDDKISKDCITISANGSGGAGFWHPYPFAATADVLVCEWRDGWIPSPAFCLYVCSAISENAWRFDYSRKSTQRRVISDVKIRLPMSGSSVDYTYIDREMNRMPGFALLMDMLKAKTKT
ncbi:MAG: N-6 DNA methylase [Rhodobacteraceae bacterium]|nr:N-6 DNA methylase [Paracoccaceae bacterium]